MLHGERIDGTIKLESASDKEWRKGVGKQPTVPAKVSSQWMLVITVIGFYVQCIVLFTMVAMKLWNLNS